MNVLHYTLGLSPYRTGGLTTWSEDLIEAQLRDGINVSLLFPGEIKLTSKKISIKSHGLHKDLPVFRLINPLPVPLIYGVDSTKHYVDYKKPVNFMAFFKVHKIDTIHLHTLMGLPIEFLEQANNMRINIVYTTHDTFGVWPEPNLKNKNAKIDPVFNLGYIGNQKALRYYSIFIAQSSMYRFLKNSKIIKKLKTVLKSFDKSSSNDSKPTNLVTKLENHATYKELRMNYKRYFDLLDTIHYNSELTKDIFESYGISRPSFVSNVYHSHIPLRPLAKDNKSKTSHEVTLLYNGTLEQYKGFSLLLAVLDKLWEEGVKNFSLVIYGSNIPERDYINAHSSYKIESISDVYAKVDITVVPSLYYETFGMVVPESLSYGVPVLVSRTVGAKSLLHNPNYGYIFNSEQDLRVYLRNIILNPSTLFTQRSKILSSKDLVFDSKKTYNDILKRYKVRARI